MRKEDFFEVLGELDEELVKGALEPMKTSGQKTGKLLMWRRVLAVAAVFALMLCSGAVGALAFSRQVTVEVPVEPETAELGGMEVTLVLPDSWQGRYEVQEAPGGGWVVYSPSVRESFLAWADPKPDARDPFCGGVLFYIVRYDVPLTEAEFLRNGWDFTGYRYLVATSHSTYILYYASDVQFDPGNAEQLAEYEDLVLGIRDIQIIVNGALGED